MMVSDHQFMQRMVQTVFTVLAVVTLMAALWIARSALMLIYVSAIIAMGFSPLVRAMELSSTSMGRQRVPRTLAILVIYLGVLGLIVLAGLAVVPPLIEQTGKLWSRAPKAFSDLQRFLFRYNLIPRRMTLQEAVQSAPPGSGGSAVNTVLSAVWGLVGGVFGVVTILILSFYLLVEAPSLIDYITRLVP